MKTPLRTDHVRIFRRNVRRGNLPRTYATVECGNCGARSQLHYYSSYRLFCRWCQNDVWHTASLPPACNCNVCTGEFPYSLPMEIGKAMIIPGKLKSLEIHLARRIQGKH